MTLQYGQIIQYLPDFLIGALMALWIAGLAFAAGLVIGLFCAAALTYGAWPLRAVVTAYVRFFTYTPQLVQVFFLFFALPEAGITLSPVAAVLIGGVAVTLGCFVEPLEINFMVGQAFAIAAASYFPLLFMSVWWRGMTMKGAATGMLTGGLCALGAAALTNLGTLALDKGPMGKIFASFAPLNSFWAEHPLLRILCEQPAIWSVPLAITLMIVVSKATAAQVPADIRMKMLVLHAPEKLGLKQEYIQDHQAGAGH
jgi:His/Glu/Gln/Arg/opine family amino acid ABC transporter permease subunit